MKRKRDDFVPIDKSSSDLGGHVKALRKASPQSRHHFTQSDQVHQLSRRPAKRTRRWASWRGCWRCAALPRTNPGNRKEYKRVNGPYKLGMTAGIDNKLPFGNLPRLLLAWVCTEAVRTKSRELVLGRSLSEFMRTLGIGSTSGGSRGDRTRLRNQMDRLFHSSVQLIYEDERSKASISSFVADRTEFWWNERKPDEPSLWDSKIELGEKFFQEIIRHPVPLDMNTLTALKRSSLGLDLYLWLVYRTFSLHNSLCLPWPHLYRQFGADPSKANDRVTVDNFRKDCLRELKKIQTAWPGLKYTTGFGLLILSPSKPAIPPAERLRLVK